LRGAVNSQNSRYWSAENSGLIYELLIYKKKSVQCVMSARRESSTVSGEELRRVNNVFRSFTECILSRGRHFQCLP